VQDLIWSGEGNGMGLKIGSVEEVEEVGGEEGRERDFKTG